MTKQLTYSTGNELKFHNAQIACEKYGITLQQVVLHTDEIQDENPENIALDKAKKSFTELGRPLVISDDSWDIPGLGGFPGAYMKSMNEWFTPHDFINLTKPLKDRRIFLHARLVYIDNKTTKLFTSTFEGHLLKEARGEYGPPSQKIVSLNGDNNLSIAEVHDKGLQKNGRAVHKMWDEFCEWYLEYTS
jgi:inosine/xanthosine triphosphate pyrophosphatase family protein